MLVSVKWQGDFQMAKLFAFSFEYPALVYKCRENKNQTITELCCGVQIRTMFCAEVMGMEALRIRRSVWHSSGSVT